MQQLTQALTQLQLVVEVLEEQVVPLDLMEVPLLSVHLHL
tara:strand:- start:441 stop:560 length:120 start_codon:yes stop_codon:yes gene_type:complete